MMRGEIRRKWPNPDAFYRERDNRTELEVRNLHRYVLRPLEIHLDPAYATDPTAQRIVLVAANLTARWARRIRVLMPEVTVSSSIPLAAGNALSSRLLLEMRSADPFGDFRAACRRGFPAGEALRLFVGPWENASDLRAEDYVVDASGWTARGRRGEQGADRKRRPATVPAAALAGAIGAGDLFKRAIQHPQADWLGRFEWSTWSHSFGRGSIVEPEQPVPAECDLGRMLLAGVGAIGSALAYVLSLSPVAGHCTLLDRDQVDVSNLNRSPLFTALDAALSRNKTAVAGELLDRLGVEVREILGTWKEHEEFLGRDLFDIWVSLTNEDAAWASVPFHLPPVVVHGTTTSGWGVAFARHIPRVEDCTLCRLPRPEAEFRGPCSEGDVGNEPLTEGPRASLPFLSTVAASLVAAELIKLPIPNALYLPNAVEADFRKGLPAVLSFSREPSPGCRGCQMSSFALWNGRGGRGRYAALSASLSESIS